jgi:MazG family protein
LTTKARAAPRRRTPRAAPRQARGGLSPSTGSGLPERVEGSSSKAGARFQALADTVARLRRGCPWDREQTLASLRPFLLEETYEVLDAIDRGDHDALEGEIGDLLFEGVFLAQICADEGRFTVADSLGAITDKLIGRHPHVLSRGIRGRRGSSARKATAKAATVSEVLGQWERIKANEQTSRGERRTVLGGLTRSLPSLLRAYEIGTRVSAVGFDWARPADVMQKVREEVDELARALDDESRTRAAEEMGDVLFALANLARKLGIEPESALRQANEKFTARFESLERRLEAQGRSVHDATLDEMEREWAAIKTDDADAGGRRPGTRGRASETAQRPPPAR